MSDNDPRQEAATNTDLSRHAVTPHDTGEYPLTIEEALAGGYSISIDEALARYEAAGISRTPRSIQRYCVKGDLDARRCDGPFGKTFMIKPESVDRHIAYIKEVRPAAASRDMSRHAVTNVAGGGKGEEPLHRAPTTSDEQRQATTSDPVSDPVAANDRIAELLERENEFLRSEIIVKNEQIKDLTERARETNHLIGGLQKLLAPLLTAPDRQRLQANGDD